MTETPKPPPAEETPTVALLLAEFEGPHELLAAAARVRDAGYRRWDAHSPYPVHGLDAAMGIRPTILPWIVLGAGITGAAVALFMQWWTNAIDYPVLISGKPLFSLPANIPVTFELIVLFSALTAFFGVLGLNLLPQWRHPAMSSSRFLRATNDRFFISIEAADPRFDAAGTRQLLESAGAASVETCYETTKGRALPKILPWAATFAVVLAVLPPLLIALARRVPSTQPRIHLIQDMDFQPRYRAQAPGPFFADDRAMRPPVPGTIAVSDLPANTPLLAGIADGKYVAGFPMPVTEEMMRRGRGRYEIYCSACHGLAGDGNGMVAKRAAQRLETTPLSYSKWVAPRDLHAAVVAQQPVGQLFDAITNGRNAMPALAQQISPEDRWAIVLYVRALQRSRDARLDDVPEASRSSLR
jgi:mono/diheme cytochrome c family protein